MQKVIVKFESSPLLYVISDDGLIKQINGYDKPNIVIVNKIDEEKVSIALKLGYKLFECKDLKAREECLTKVLNAVFPYCKVCKFI
ncbi:MAG: hypothetical protein QW685_05400 [Saccharolobus sp.]